ncbi:MAG: hypothetical protein ACLGIR_13650 [Actinomycetes bacterium]
MGDSSWTFLVIGGFGAVGAALALGTAAALLRFHRTGAFPGADPSQEPQEVSTGRIVALWVRVVVGAVLATYALVTLGQRGLLTL